jgi:hypothetical protein
MVVYMCWYHYEEKNPVSQPTSAEARQKRLERLAQPQQQLQQQQANHKAGAPAVLEL